MIIKGDWRIPTYYDNLRYCVCVCAFVFTLLLRLIFSQCLSPSMHVTLPSVDPSCSLLHQPVPVEAEEREGQQESRWRSFGKIGGAAERQGRDSGLVSRAEDQRHEAEGQEGNLQMVQTWVLSTAYCFKNSLITLYIYISYVALTHCQTHYITCII